jgi:hypothetical protein
MGAQLVDEAVHLRVTALKWHFAEPEPLHGRYSRPRSLKAKSPRAA